MSVAQALISYARQGGRGGVGDVYAALAASRAARAQAMPAVQRSRTQSQVAAPVEIAPGGGWGGSYKVASGLAEIAKQQGLGVTSEKRPRQYTASGGVSDHWEGSKNAYAFDLAGSPEQMDEAARRLMRALGARYEGGELVSNTYRDGYRTQVIYRTNVGGNHFDHIHVGVKRVE